MRPLLLHLFTIALVVHSTFARAELSTTPLTSDVLCERVLRAIETVPAKGRVHPVHGFFSTFDRVRARASLGAFGADLASYAGPDSLVVVEAGRPFATPTRVSSAAAYRNLFRHAARDGEDFALARVNLAIDQVNQAIDEALACAGYHTHLRPRQPDRFCSHLTRGRARVVDSALDVFRTGWTELGPRHRRAFLDWLGREVVEGLGAERTYRIDFANLDRHGQPVPQRLPAFPRAHVGRDLYLKRHRGEAADEELRRRYHREVATRLMAFYGDASSDFAALVDLLVNGAVAP